MDQGNWICRITSNKSTLCQLTSSLSLIFLDTCVERKVLTRYEKDVIEAIPLDYDRKSKFYDTILTKGEKNFRVMVEIMKESETEQSDDVLNILTGPQGLATGRPHNHVAPLVGSSILVEKDIHKIVQIMIDCYPLCLQKLQFYMALGLPLANSLNLPDNHHQFFTFTMAEWIARNTAAQCPPTVDRLVSALKSMKMNAVAGSILDMERNGEFEH